jgi:hypothetical protein
MRNLDDYPFEIRPLSAVDGGGFLITDPDFNVCMSDGETVEEAIANGRDALSARAKMEGVSLNTLAVAFMSAGIERTRHVGQSGGR